MSILFQSKSWFIEKHKADLDYPLKDTVKKLLLVSDYACKYVHLLKALLIQDSCNTLLSRKEYFDALKKVPFTLSPVIYARELRQFRHTHFLRLLLLELSGVIGTEEVMSAWSDCADALILHALTYCSQDLSVRHGIPRNAEGKEVILLTLAMGKLGGRELNYSSDIDLIFAYTCEGKTDGEECLDNQHYFSKVAQQFSQLLQNVTPDGFVFRVDLRLRPNGESGPLVSSLAAMENYYQEQGRDWERYAMVKARVVEECLDVTPSWFERLIIPFVYRRYVDFSVIESLRSMKAMIEREVHLNPRLDDIKRGKGGIREVEFIIQNFQLIRGGRLPQLQKQNALAALGVLKQEELLQHSDALKLAYLFLRRLENILQSLNDQQTHSLPDDVMKQAQILLAMGYDSWDDLLAKLHQYQRIISYAFHSVLGKVDAYEDEKRVLANQLASLWQGHVETHMAVNLLSSLGFENAEHCYQIIYAFRHGPRCRRLPQGARMRLDRFMVLLLTELAQVKKTGNSPRHPEHSEGSPRSRRIYIDPYVRECATAGRSLAVLGMMWGVTKTDEILLHVLHLLEKIVGRSAYLALLTENPKVLTELLFWFAHSPFMTSLLVNQPFLLEVLLDQDQEWRPQSRQQLEAQLLEKLAYHPDVEAEEEILRQFKLINWLMAARAELYGVCTAVRIGKFLADVAQVIVSQVFVIAQKQLSLRHPEMERIHTRFAIIAYGKLGSREMNYASDLDLVFLHTVPPEDEALVTRLTQKILHMLTTRSQSGVLYAVDTRLRPSGAAGLLVSHVGAFVTYQKNQAWTWEHQALLKTRIVAGSQTIRRLFLKLKKEVLLLPRERAILQQDILSMRAKIEHHQDTNRLKSVVSGLWDLEFLVQFLVIDLGRASAAQYTHTLSQLQYLFTADVLNKEQVGILKKAYKLYHHLLHHHLLRPEEVDVERMKNDVLTVLQNFI